jgi:hypothetical protein
MAIIYSYPINNNIQLTDIIVGTSTVLVGGRPKNQTKSFEVQELINFMTPYISQNLTPNLQQVLTVGNQATSPIITSVAAGDGDGGNFASVDGYGVTAQSVSGVGLNAVSTSDNAISAATYTGPAAIQATNNGSGYAGFFYTDNGVAVYAISDTNDCIVGNSNDGMGVKGTSVNGNGGNFSSEQVEAVKGVSIDGSGVYGVSNNSIGVFGESNDSIGGLFSSSSTYSLVAAQSAAKPGGGSWSAYSDSRVKENIKPYTKGLTELLLVNPVNYEYNGLAGTIKGIEYTGVIAQEIKDIFPETVNTYNAKLNEDDEEKTELYDFNSTALIFALINAVKELSERIVILENK